MELSSNKFDPAGKWRILFGSTFLDSLLEGGRGVFRSLKQTSQLLLNNESFNDFFVTILCNASFGSINIMNYAGRS